VTSIRVELDPRVLSSFIRDRQRFGLAPVGRLGRAVRAPVGPQTRRSRPAVHPSMCSACILGGHGTPLEWGRSARRLPVVRGRDPLRAPTRLGFDGGGIRVESGASRPHHFIVPGLPRHRRVQDPRLDVCPASPGRFGRRRVDAAGPSPENHGRSRACGNPSRPRRGPPESTRVRRGPERRRRDQALSVPESQWAPQAVC
jgi:hypothetical protein